MANLEQGISSRIFGDDILDEVKDKLYLRQELNKKSNLFESVDSIKSPYTGKSLNLSTYNTSFNGEADLSSRTPFARLWTAIEIVEEEEVTENAAELFSKGTTNPADKTNYDDNYYCDGNDIDDACYKYVPSPDGNSTRIYTLGNHVLDTFSINPGDSISQKNTNTFIDTVAPNEQSYNKNEFMRPPGVFALLPVLRLF